jgi:hypothetical protein
MSVESSADGVPAGDITTPLQAPEQRHLARLFVPLLAGALVSLTLGIYAKVHTPTGIAVDLAGFSSPLTVKVWLCTLAAFFALIQLFSALVMWGKITVFGNPSWTGTLHRWSGRVAFLATVPVAMHCLYALGFESYSARVLFHSIMGCLFFGVFTVKMLVLTKKGLAGWVLPVVGGTVFSLLILIWLTSALWFFTTKGVYF